MSPRCWLGYHGVKGAPDIEGAKAVVMCGRCGSDVMKQPFRRWRKASHPHHRSRRDDAPRHLVVEDFLDGFAPAG